MNNPIKIDTNDNKIIETDQFYRSLFEHNPDMVYFLNTEGIIVKVNSVFSEVLGYQSDEIVAKSMEQVLAVSEILPYKEEFHHQVLSGETQNVDSVFLNKNGDPIQVNVTIIPAINDNKKVIGIFGIAKDVTERKKVEELTHYYAYHDSLADLPNRIYFQEKVEQEIAICHTLNQKFAVIYLDLDHFKNINHSLGLTIGDQLIVQVSRKLQNFVKDGMILARVAGDEYGILIPNIQNAEDVVLFSKSMMQLFEEPFCVGDYKLYVTLSIGICIYPNDAEDAYTLMNFAHSALNKAKESGRNTFQIYSSSMSNPSLQTYSVGEELRKAIEKNELELFYQPKISIMTNHIVGAEALIRWHHPKWGLLSPDEFIPFAEESGLIVEIEKWIGRTVCMQNIAWQRSRLPAIPISINLSAKRFLQMNLSQSIADILKESNLDPQYIEIEITETSLLANEKIVYSILDEMNEIGIKISLDDFGTGYSSLSYLKLFKGRINTLKIDRSFISDLSMANQEGANYITKSIIQLAQSFKMNIVAEGVETKEQLVLLKRFGCDTVQGYLFSKPVPAKEFAVLLKKGKIEVSDDSQRPENIIAERRKYFRIPLDFPLIAGMTINQINGIKVELGKTGILIENIGLGGLRFLSKINLPVQRSILLECDTEILGSTIAFYGALVWVKEIKTGIFQYGMEFIVDENERSEIARVLNHFMLLLRKSPLVPDCSFLTTDRYQFFNESNKKESE